VYAERAAATYAAMQQALYVSRQTSLYRETTPAGGGNPFAYVWPQSRALVGTLALAGMPGAEFRSDVKDRVDALAWYWDGHAYASYVIPPYGSGGDRYSDDNTWIGLALVQHQRMALGNSLRQAQRVFTYLRSAWDRKRGGLYWVEQGRGFGLHNHDRGAGATAGAASLGFHLQDLSGSVQYSEEAVQMLEWVRSEMDSAGTGVGPFYNAVREDGSVDTNLWSYNQGVVIGAYVMRYRVSGDLQFLRLAEAIARQTLATFGDFTHQPPSFNAMCFQNLLMLHALTRDAELQSKILQRMTAYADWTWDPSTGARDPDTDLFYFTDAGRPNAGRQPARLQDQGAMLQLYALLAWNTADYTHLA
jgi:glycosyl hydrolase family 76